MSTPPDNGAVKTGSYELNLDNESFLSKEARNYKVVSTGNHVYAVWTQSSSESGVYLQVSTDNGTTFDPPRKVGNITPNRTVERLEIAAHDREIILAIVGKNTETNTEYLQLSDIQDFSSLVHCIIETIIEWIRDIFLSFEVAPDGRIFRIAQVYRTDGKKLFYEPYRWLL